MVWKLFQKKPKIEDDTILEIASKVAISVKLQMTIAAGHEIENADGSLKRRAIGYVYGFTDAVLRGRGLDMADTTIGVPVLNQVMRELWPERVNDYMLFVVKNIRTDTLMLAGAMHGGEQFVEYIRDGKLPAGLARFLIEGDAAGGADK